MTFTVSDSKRLGLVPALLMMVLCFQVQLSAQEKAPTEPTDTYRQAMQLYQKAVAAYKEKNYPKFFENLDQAVKLRPGYPRLMYNLACACALTGRNNESIEWLKKIADMGLVFDIEKDDDLNSIKDSAGFKEIQQKFNKNKTPISHSQKAFSLPEKDLVTEGVAYDPVEETFYVSSVHKRKIVSFDRLGVVKDFASEKDGLLSVLGMKVDARHRVLWASSTAFTQMTGFKDDQDGCAGVFKFDLTTHRLIKKYLVPGKPEKHVFGDLTCNSQGDVFITDSLSPVIYTISQKKDELEEFLRSNEFISLQGITFSEDQKFVFVSDYPKGIYKIDVLSKKVFLLPYPQNSTVLGVDGLYFYQGDLIGSQNGVNPNRVIRMTLSSAFEKIDKVTILEANSGLIDEPTLGVLVGDHFFYISNSQWGAFDKDEKTLLIEKLREPLILKLKL